MSACISVSHTGPSQRAPAAHAHWARACVLTSRAVFEVAAAGVAVVVVVCCAALHRTQASSLCTA